MKLGRPTEEKQRTASADEGGKSGVATLGLTIAPAAQVEGAGSKGLAVLDVDANGKAAELGFQQGDVILKAGGKELSRPDDLKTAMSETKAEGRKSMLVLVKRGAAVSYMAVPVAKG